MTTATLAQPTTPETTSGLHVQILGENLLIAVNAIKPAIAKDRYNLEIMRSVLIKTDRGMLTFTLANLDFAARYYAGAKVDSEGAALVPFRTLETFAKTAKSGTVCIDQEGPRATRFTGCRMTTTLHASADADDFMHIHEVQGPTVRVPRLGEEIKRVAPYASNYDDRPILHGIRFEMGGAHLTMSAADGFRLAWQTLPTIEQDTPHVEAVIPTAAALCAARALASKSRYSLEMPELTISDDGLFARIRGDRYGTEVITRTIQGTLPNWRQLIPESPTHTLTVERLPFLNAVESAGGVARDGSGIIRLAAEGETLTVSAHADEIGTVSADAPMVGAIDTPARISFNMTYLTTAIKGTKDDVLTLQFNEDGGPGLFPMGDGGSLVMPMLVDW